MKFKELLEIAKTELADLVTNENPDWRLEQAEYYKNEKEWDIVVSFLVPRVNKGIPSAPEHVQLTLNPALQFQRIYKRLRINEDKKVQGFFIYHDEL